MNNLLKEGRRDCPLCGGSNTLNVTVKEGRQLLHCHRCKAPFKELLNALGGATTPATTSRRTANQKPTHAQAAAKARKSWKAAKSADQNHPYLARKGIQPHGIRQDNDGNLIIPAQNIYSEITTIQTIDPTGEKRFLSGGTKKGSFFILDDQAIDPDGIVYICEGFATAASIQEATGKPTACAFDAGNLQPLAELRQHYPTLNIVICGDDDRFKDQNPGYEKATAAALAVNGKVCFPSFQNDDGKPTDFNDLHCREDLEAVKAQIEAATFPIEDQAAIIKCRVEKLTQLDPIAREIERKKIMKECNISAKAVDAYFTSLQKTEIAESNTIVSEVEPWPDEVDGANLLSQMAGVFSRFAVLPDNMGAVMALWAMLTYCYDLFRILPQIAIYSPEKRCGKSTVLEILHALVLRGLIASNISSAAVYRTIEKYKPCLFIDEADTFYKENAELQGICNSGHTKKTAFVIRVEGDNHEPHRFSTWGPKVIALIGALRNTQHDRSIVISMRRKLPGERVEKLPYDLEKNCLEIRQKCVRWIADNENRLKSITPLIPETGNDRQTDNWNPLFIIAECAGGEWPEIVRGALLGIAEDADDNDSIAIKLLRDIQTVFLETRMDKLSSEKIVESLKGLKDAPWSDWNHGRGLTQHSLSRQLKPFKVKPEQQWINGKNQRGYNVYLFKDTFKRYLSAPVPPIQTAKPLEASNCAGFPGFENARPKNVLAIGKLQEPTARLSSSTLAVENGGAESEEENCENGAAFIHQPRQLLSEVF